MIQSYDQIKNQANLVNNSLTDSVFIQKIYSSSYYLCLTIRLVGQSKYLYLGRGSGHEGIWYSELRVESFLRKIDKFLEYIRKHLSSTSVHSISVDNKDRIFSINYQKWGRINRFYFFYNARNLYFANHFYDTKSGNMMLFKSWTMKNELCEVADFGIFDEVGRQDLERKEGVSLDKTIGALLSHEKQQAMKGNAGGKSKKFYNRKRRRILEDLEKVQSISIIQAEIDKNENLESLDRVSHFGKLKVKFKTKEHFHRRDELYTKIKKLKKAQGILSLRLNDTEDKLQNYQKVSLNNNLKAVAPVWKSQKNTISEKNAQEKSYKIIKLPEITIGIGLNAVGNDQLRNEWAKKSDYWFHLDGDKSAHIIVKLGSKLLDENVFTIAGSALIEFSQVDYTEANLIYTQVKNLKGVKGAAGKVLFKKEKRIKTSFNEDWRNITL